MDERYLYRCPGCGYETEPVDAFVQHVRRCQNVGVEPASCGVYRFRDNSSPGSVFLCPACLAYTTGSHERLRSHEYACRQKEPACRNQPTAASGRTDGSARPAADVHQSPPSSPVRRHKFPYATPAEKSTASGRADSPVEVIETEGASRLARLTEPAAYAELTTTAAVTQVVETTEHYETTTTTVAATIQRRVERRPPSDDCVDVGAPDDECFENPGEQGDTAEQPRDGRSHSPVQYRSSDEEDDQVSPLPDNEDAPSGPQTNDGDGDSSAASLTGSQRMRWQDVRASKPAGVSRRQWMTQLGLRPDGRGGVRHKKKKAREPTTGTGDSRQSSRTSSHSPRRRKSRYDVEREASPQHDIRLVEAREADITARARQAAEAYEQAPERGSPRNRANPRVTDWLANSQGSDAGDSESATNDGTDLQSGSAQSDGTASSRATRGTTAKEDQNAFGANRDCRVYRTDGTRRDTPLFGNSEEPSRHAGAKGQPRQSKKSYLEQPPKIDRTHSHHRARAPAAEGSHQQQGERPSDRGSTAPGQAREPPTSGRGRVSAMRAAAIAAEGRRPGGSPVVLISPERSREPSPRRERHHHSRDHSGRRPAKHDRSPSSRRSGRSTASGQYDDETRAPRGGAHHRSHETPRGYANTRARHPDSTTSRGQGDRLDNSTRGQGLVWGTLSGKHRVEHTCYQFAGRPRSGNHYASRLNHDQQWPVAILPPPNTPGFMRIAATAETMAYSAPLIDRRDGTDLGYFCVNRPLPLGHYTLSGEVQFTVGGTPP